VSDPPTIPEPAWPRVATALALVALVGWSAWVRWQALTSSPFPVGVDGYFYPLQLRALLATGHLAFPASPLTFWLMAPLAAATDPITGAKLGSAIGLALIALPIYGVGVRLGGGRGPGLLAAAIATTSAGSAFLGAEFVKNGLGLTIATTALWLVLRACERPRLARIALAVLAIVAAFLAHKMATALTLGLGLPAVLGAWMAGRGRRAAAVGLGLIVVSLAALVIALGTLAPQRFLSAQDLGMLRHLVSRTARWDAPALATASVTLVMDHEARSAAILALIAVVALIASPWPRLAVLAPPAGSTRAAAVTVVVLALITGLPWLVVDDAQGLGFRLRAAAFVPLALVAAVVAGAAWRGLGALDGVWRDAPTAPQRTLALAALALALVVRAPTERDEGVVHAHPAMVAAVTALAGVLPADAIAIVPERHIMFMVAWYTGARVSLRPELVSQPQRWRILTLAFIGEGSALDALLLEARRQPTLNPPRGVHPSHPNGLVVVDEATWTWIVERLPQNERRRALAWPTI
jgi:hypothetical protein